RPGIEPGPARVRMVERAAIRRPGEPVRDLGAHLRRLGPPVGGDAEQDADLLALGTLVHRADPEGAVRADLAVVEARVVRPERGPNQGAPHARVGVVEDHLAPQRDDEPAAFAEAEAAHLGLELVPAGIAARGIEHVDGVPDDVDVEQNLAAIVPYRTFAE